MNFSTLYDKALKLKFLTGQEGLDLYLEAPTQELISLAHTLRNIQAPEGIVSWQIDRNVNISNICYSQCKFCNFYRKPGSKDAYITSFEEYKAKIEELFDHGGNQILLQGGLNQKMGIDFYTRLFRELKKNFPKLKLHALGPPEIVHLAKLEKFTYKEVLETLIDSGLDSLPGAGAEILCDRVRKNISPLKANTKEWLDVMREAHKLNIPSSATMMFGHVETKEERINHLIKIRDVQSEKPTGNYGFLAFIPWPFQDTGTQLQKEMGVFNMISSEEYIRMIAISRIMLPNIKNIQASWLTVGKETAQICLHSGANDLGSIMIEENVVSSAGAQYKFDAAGITAAIREAGFQPQLRNQKYEYLKNPENLTKT
ncbi:MAG: cyclic dehypoxanthinyl futalosine synthase [Bacteroidota bacterium]|nr:cyclic dehypoxanthinyl futalosine synthase [Bacteroidota bacterium]